MPDVYSQLTDLDVAAIRALAQAMELRAADPVQQGFVDSYMSQVVLPEAGRILEVGCGTGAVSRRLAARPDVGEVVGIDPLSPLLDLARDLAEGIDNLSFRLGRGEQLPVDDSSFHAVVIHTVLSHVPDPSAVLDEARRALVDGGWLAVFDGDYATLSFALAENDPLEVCAAAFRSSHINDARVMRRAAALIEGAGFVDLRLESHGLAQVTDPSYMLWVLVRGASALVSDGVIGVELADALLAEARRRVSQGSFFGQVSYLSVVARKRM